MSSKGTRKGFTLIELIIVLVILGIIAAIAIPRLSSSSKNAGEASLRANLVTLRNAIDWYYGEHNMKFPAATADGLGNPAGSSETLVNQLTMYSDAQGKCSADKDPAFPYGPYIHGKFPKLPVGANAGTDTVSVNNMNTLLTANPTHGDGWVYSYTTGRIIANTNETGINGKTYDTW